MQQYNMFNQVHKGLRALLYETALQIQHTDFWNVEEAEAVIERINEVVALFEKHAYSEDTYVFPAIEKYEPSVADAFEQEHVTDHFLGQQLSESIALYKNAAIITDKVEAAKKIYPSYVKFMAFNLEHMAKEEEIINPLLWRYYTEADLMAITRQIVSNIPPEHMIRFSKWMIRGLNNAEICRWLREVEETAPEVVFKALFVTAEKELSEKRFRQVLEGLTEGAMVA
ncbi:MAG: hemerythrin domain-containing protein [Bacteroidota bacterium]|nr:hemerythrin domain-containing protein [Bacteroidota bacterium]